MSFILVCTTDSSCRRLYVDNLVLRGYIAVGIASTDEAQKLLQHETPQLILICCSNVGQENAVHSFRQMSNLDSIPIVMVDDEMPDQEWMKTWGVSACLPYPLDLRKLVPSIQPWLTGRTCYIPSSRLTHQAELQNTHA
jgi:DNA-binding response OmpR family regulator